MRPTLTCPKCQVRLHLPEPLPDGPMVCPRCGGEVKDAPPAPVLDLSAPLVRPVAAASTPQEPMALPPARRREPGGPFEDPKKRGFVLILAIIGAATTALWWRLACAPILGPRGSPGAADVESTAVGMVFLAVVLVAHRQVWAEKPSTPQVQGLAAAVLFLFSAAGCLSVGLVAIAILLFCVCVAIRG